MIAVMARSYLPVDREQPFLLPPDMREWLPARHLVWFVLDVVRRVDTAVLHRQHPNDGAGRRAYDPDMLLALLLYAYCTGQRSSRQIERLCEVDVAYRVLCANHCPDHTTIARFRQAHEQLAVALFIDALELCAYVGLATVGVIAVDGTKMAADASLNANRTRASIEEEVRRMFGEAAAVDAEQDTLFGRTRGDELPAELTDPTSRAARLDRALAQLRRGDAERETTHAQRAAKEAEAAARGQRVRGRRPDDTDPVADAETRLTLAQQRAKDRRAAIEARAAAEGRRVPGTPPGDGPRVGKARQRLAAARQAAEQADQAANQSGDDDDHPPRPRANVTDPDSRTMKTANGWVQGFNAQAAVNEHGVVVACDVTQDHNDVRQCQPMMTAIQASLDAAGIDDPVDLLLFDAGYWSDDNATTEGPDRLIATTKTHRQRAAARALGTTSGPPPPDATPREAMEHRLRTVEGVTLYAKRSTTIEPVFGQHKHDRGWRRFLRRGLTAAKAEWHLMNTAHNLLKAFHHQHHTAPA